MYFTKDVYVAAIRKYWKTLDKQYLVYGDEEGLNAFIAYLRDNIEFELEIVMAFMDDEFGLEEPMPYPEFEGGD
tara:strand:- start:7318 stop:7539 length:222 start_codon:yes stop_codon:yes gene_type:complete